MPYFSKLAISIHVAASGLLSRVSGFDPLNPGAATLLDDTSFLFRAVVRLREDGD